MRFLIHNAVIINRGKRFRGYVEVTDGRIVRVSEGAPGQSALESYGTNAIDLRGNWLLPGVIDSHVHFRDPGLTHKADIRSESRAAVAGGVTSFIDMPNTVPPTLSMADIRGKMDVAASASLANYAFYIGASANNFDELKNADYTVVPGIKLFLGSSTGNMCVADSKVLDRIFSLPALVAVHCEDEDVIKRNSADVRGLFGSSEVAAAWHPVIRSELACYKSTASAVERAVRLGTRLHVCHVSTQEELELVRGKKNITAEACIAHLWFDDSDYGRLGTLIKCNPAIKGVRHRQALRKALTDGTIDVVSTDHAPHTRKEKDGDVFSAPSGMPMVQFSLRVMLRLAAQGVLSVERVVELMCHNQADLFGIKDRGYIDVGCYADLVEIKPNGTDECVCDTEVVSKCGWTPLAGECLPDTVERVWVNGAIAFDHGLFASAATGMSLRFALRMT